MKKGEKGAAAREIATLTSAFHKFSEETERLEKAYEKLQANFLEVSQKLEESDATLQKKALELDKVTHTLQNIATHISEGILFVGQEGIITTINKAAGSLLGIDPQAALFQQVWNYLPDTTFGFSLKDALRSHEAPPLVYLSLGDKELDISISFVSKGHKTDHGMVLLIRDITQIRRLQMQTQLQGRMKELGEMAAFVAHEIRNPLGGILGFASLLKRELESEGKPTDKVDNIIEGTQVLNQLVEEVLHYARPIKIKLKACDLRTTVHNLVSHLKADSKTAHGIDLTYDLPQEPVLVQIDERLILSALFNLARNGVEAMPQGGKLGITLCADEERAKITITDTGVGIDKGDLMKIFTPFFTTKERGTGLGLAEAYKIAEGHLGKLELSSALGVGTACTLTLPRGRQ